MANGNIYKPFNSVIDVKTTDLNTIVDTGFYSFGASSPNRPNPDKTVNGNMIVIKGIDFTHQIALAGNSEIYMRRRMGSAWNDWKLITLS